MALQVTKQIQKSSVISDILPDQVWYIIQSGFGVISKIISVALCEPIHDIINYSTFICLFECAKCGKETKIVQTKSFLDEMKSFFVVFKGLSLGQN